MEQNYFFISNLILIETKYAILFHMENIRKEIGFDNELYLKLQSENILKRIDMFHNKLYLEFGGKLFDDYHASRVLPGFDPNIKTKLLLRLKDKAEIIFCINANDIEKNKIRSDTGNSYDNEVLRLVDNLRSIGLYVSSIVITLYTGQTHATMFINKLKHHGENVYIHTPTKGYPNDVETIVSDEGYGANPYIKTTRPLVVVTAPGGSSGKLATCLSQLYHEYKHGVNAGYAKFETFPVWNLDLNHPINVAYEASTADLKDVNQIDPFHMQSKNEIAINYNRDIEVFPVLYNILKKITGKEIYKSPTEMGVNMIASAIINDELCRKASKREIIRRYYRAECDYLVGRGSLETVERTKFLLAELGLNPNSLDVVRTANELSERTGYACVALELKDKRIVTGKGKNIMSASGAMILNALRTLAGMGDEDVISDEILMPMIDLRKKYFNSNASVLTVDDILVALAISSSTNPRAKQAIAELDNLACLNAHSSHILCPLEERTLKKLRINITCEPKYKDNKLFNE